MDWLYGVQIQGLIRLRYGVENARITSIELGDMVVSSPPSLPKEMNILKSIYWSLCFRIWANWQLVAVAIANGMTLKGLRSLCANNKAYGHD